MAVNSILLAQAGAQTDNQNAVPVLFQATTEKPVGAQADFGDDARLERKVTLACKNVSFRKLCGQLQAAVGLPFSADASVADNNVTLFCRERPARDVLLQTAQLFQFTWQRSGTAGAYRYELTQTPLQKAQEAQIRQQDHLSALALFQERMERYRPYVNLSDAQLNALLEKAAEAEKNDIRVFQHHRRAAITMYLSLSDTQKQALLDGKPLTYSTQNNASELPPLVKSAIFDKFKDIWGYKQGDSHGFTSGTNLVVNGVAVPEGPHVVDAPDAYATLRLQILRNTSGKFNFLAVENVRVPSLNFDRWEKYDSSETLPPRSILPLDNARANAALARDAAMQQTITLQIKPSYTAPVSAPPVSMPPVPALTTADYLEAVFHATGMDIVGDNFERLQAMAYLKTEATTLFDALSFNCDRLRLRWNREGDWLTFRSLTYFDMRSEQVPNRLLERWAASRREHGAATLDDLAEMSRWGADNADEEDGDNADHATSLPRHLFNDGSGNVIDAYVVGVYGLREWGLARNERLRPHWRLLAQIPPELRHSTATPQGLPFTRIPLALRPTFITRAVAGLKSSIQPGLPEMLNAALRVQYTPVTASKSVPVSSEPPVTFQANGRTVTLHPPPNLPPPNWKVKFIYHFGSKRAGQWRHVIEPNGGGFREPGEPD